MIDRRTLLKTSAAAALVASASKDAFSAPAAGEFRLEYILASCMYGYFDLATILPEVAKVGATAIDIWPMKRA